jgi:hypothetical protein
MKKLLYLLFAICLIGCDSDDNISTQTFLEKYDGVFWASYVNSREEPPLYVFSPEGMNIYDYDFKEECNGHLDLWGVEGVEILGYNVTNDSVTQSTIYKYTILENSENLLKLKTERRNGVGFVEPFETIVISTLTVEENKNVINIESEIIKGQEDSDSFKLVRATDSDDFCE